MDFHKKRKPKKVKANIFSHLRSGYGARLSAVISELSGSHDASRQTVQDFCQSVLALPISTGGIQRRIIDRSSVAIKSFYNAIGDQARKQDVNGIAGISGSGKCYRCLFERSNPGFGVDYCIIADPGYL